MPAVVSNGGSSPHRSHSVTLRRKSDNEPHHRTGNQDFPEVLLAGVGIGSECKRKCEQRAHRETKGDAHRKIIDLRATQPISTPATRPLPIDPSTIPTMPGATSGAERSAVKPSTAPRTPPASRPSIGLSMEIKERVDGVVGCGDVHFIQRHMCDGAAALDARRGFSASARERHETGAQKGP